MLAWDESKRISNLQAHGLDFAGVDAVFDAPVWSWEDTREAYGEQRINLVGWLRGQLVHLTYTDDGDVLRAISLRKAEKHEIRRYLENLAR